MRRRKHGISLLVPTQNAEQTIELCLRSFAEFADEMIVVDNGSTDRTVEIIQSVQSHIPNMQFHNVPHLVDLYHNRQYAFKQSKYNWIMRIDSDYIAYTEGPRDIRKLRERILNTKRTFPPIAYGITQVNLLRDFWHAYKPTEGKLRKEVTTLPARILQCYPGLKFKRLNRWEGVRFQRYLQHVQIEEPYWFHCQFKSDMAEFYRSERTNWREHGDYKTYPTLESYIKAIIPNKYGTPDMDEACSIFVDREVLPRMVRYDEKKYYPYPSLIRKAMNKTSSPTISQ